MFNMIYYDVILIVPHLRDVEKVLSHKKEKQELSNELTFHVLTVRHQFASNFCTV